MLSSWSRTKTILVQLNIPLLWLLAFLYIHMCCKMMDSYQRPYDGWILLLQSRTLFSCSTKQPTTCHVPVRSKYWPFLLTLYILIHYYYIDVQLSPVQIFSWTRTRSIQALVRSIGLLQLTFVVPVPSMIENLTTTTHFWSSLSFKMNLGSIELSLKDVTKNVH